eukprot:g18491.t2
MARSPLFDLEVPRHYVILASLTVVFPLYISFLSISAITFLTLVVAAKTPEHLADLEGSNDSSGTSVQTVLQCFAMALFSFNAHTNAVPVALSLDQPRATRIWHVSLVSVLIELLGAEE